MERGVGRELDKEPLIKTLSEVGRDSGLFQDCSLRKGKNYQHVPARLRTGGQEHSAVTFPYPQVSVYHNPSNSNTRSLRTTHGASLQAGFSGFFPQERRFRLGG